AVMPAPKRFFLATRPYSYTASLVPAVLGSVVALDLHGGAAGFAFDWLHFALAVVGCVLIQIVANVINDVVDYDTGLDNAENFGAMNVLVQGLTTRKEMLVLTAVTFAAALAIGAYFIAVCGEVVAWLVGIGALTAVFYTAPPLKLKYRGWGDVLVIGCFGILMTLGAYYTQAYTLYGPGAPFSESLFSPALWTIVLIAVPISLLVDAILQANNHRDREQDLAYGARTVAVRMSEGASLRFQYVLVFGAYAVLALIVALGFVTPLALLAYLTLPLALKNLKLIRSKGTVPMEQYGMLPMVFAQLHLAFGALMVVGLLLGYVLGI
ncbi:MAG: prenyltransferase, partial [Rhodothermales bacterium]|nr:prenyltransferase [Rhodothermales bacterium]